MNGKRPKNNGVLADQTWADVVVDLHKHTRSIHYRHARAGNAAAISRLGGAAIEELATWHHAGFVAEEAIDWLGAARYTPMPWSGAGSPRLLALGRDSLSAARSAGQESHG